MSETGNEGRQWAPLPPPPPGYGAPTPWGPPVRSDALAIASLVCGIISIPLVIACVLGLVGGVLGLVFGFIARSRIRRSHGALTGAGMALAGIICGAVGVALSVAYAAFIVASLSSTG